ncbi:hypothetical protein JVU11DRAFT_4111 [Chiua virens]|nr:hypothetical protein JVU11DRAFT_4111 [Chiua virens]
MFSKSLATLLAFAISLPISTSLAAYLDVTSPVFNQFLFVGLKYNVTWDTSSPPGQISVPFGTINLVVQGAIQHDAAGVLASNVKFADGHAQIIAPSVPTGDYQLALIGDSIKYSPQFAIVQPE